MLGAILGEAPQVVLKEFIDYLILPISLRVVAGAEF